MPVKQYLTFEGERNRRWAPLYERMLKLAYGASNAVLVGHHICFEDGGDISTENEVPSADCLLFDHEVMGRLFGADATTVMQSLAALRAEFREEFLEQCLDVYGVQSHMPPVEDDRATSVPSPASNYT